MTPLDFAKAYLSWGWSLIPIVPETKEPAVKWMEFNDRRPTLTEVEGWLNNNWHLALVTGAISGILIVDDDRVKNGLNEWGFDSSVIAKTQSGGKHYYFKYDREIHSHSNTTLHVDLKAWHSYCLLPPFNGREWITKPSENLSKLAPIPDELVRLINSDKSEREQKREPLQMADFINISNGSRTESIHRLACSIFNHLSKEDGQRVLMGVNQTYSPPLDDVEFTYQISSAWQFVQDHPKSTPKITIRPVNLTTSSGVKTERLIIKSTGFSSVDLVVKELRSGGSYLFAGEEKSGKTSLLLNIIAHWVTLGHKIFYGSTELQKDDVSEYLTGITGDKEWLQKNPNFIFFDLGEAGSLNDHLQLLESELAKGLRIVVVDNLTSYRDLTEINGSEWEKISFAGDSYRRLSRKWNALFVLVVHVNQGGKLREIPRSVKDMIASNQPENIFQESISVFRRPDTSDIKGGSGFRSQTQGQFLLWRPYQQFNSTKLNKLSLLIIENNRFGETGDIPLLFDGITKTFIEVAPPASEYTPSQPKNDLLDKTSEQLSTSEIGGIFHD